MKTLSKPAFGFLVALALVLSLTNAQTAKAIPATEQMIFRSWADGYIVESDENSGVGATTNETEATFLVGDDAEDRQILAVFKFPTMNLPDPAIITMAKVQIEQSGSVGNPGFGSPVFEIVTSCGDIHSGYINPGCFAAPASATLTGQIAHVDNYLTKFFGSDEFQYIIPVSGGTLQLRFRLDVDDNDNGSADYGIYYGDEAVNPASRPTLIVEYYLPENPIERMSFRSVAAQDGYIWESTENSGVGLRVNSGDTTIRVGDDNQDRQYVGILSFNTARLPDNALITWARLLVRSKGTVGFLDFHLVFEIKSPFFGMSAALRPSDFQDPATYQLTYCLHYLDCIFRPNEFQFINLQGTTQIRFRFSVGDNDNMSADYRILYSGNVTNPNSKPSLIVEYYLP